ncbi:MAG: hypothetical protein GXP46_03470 [Deferribacteres bacterium]|nr:hypothetical protein [Deferribacteres bacterium]
MKTVLSITDARKKLPAIIRALKSAPDTVYQITVHNEVVAEIKSPSIVTPGEAATKLIELRKKLRGKRKGYRIPVSEDIKQHLYVAEDSD